MKVGPGGEGSTGAISERHNPLSSRSHRLPVVVSLAVSFGAVRLRVLVSDTRWLRVLGLRMTAAGLRSTDLESVLG